MYTLVFMLMVAQKKNFLHSPTTFKKDEMINLRMKFLAMLIQDCAGLGDTYITRGYNKPI